MCLKVYISTPEPLSGVTFYEEVPPGHSPDYPLHFEEISNSRASVPLLNLLKGRYLYYLGCDGGCSCNLESSSPIVDFDAEEMKVYEYENLSTTALVDFLRTYTLTKGSLEMYIGWAGDPVPAQVEHSKVNVTGMTPATYFEIAYPRRYTFYWG